MYEHVPSTGHRSNFLFLKTLYFSNYLFLNPILYEITKLSLILFIATSVGRLEEWQVHIDRLDKW